MATQKWGMNYETKSRPVNLMKPINGIRVTWTRVPGQPESKTTAVHKFSCVGGQKTTSRSTTFHLAQKQLRLIKEGKLKVPAYSRMNLEQGDFGSNFETTKNEYELKSPEFTVKAIAGYTTYDYRGPFAATGQGEIPQNSLRFPRVTPPSAQYLYGLGGTAVSRCLPTSPAVDLATFLGELREGLPKLAGMTATDAFLKAGRKKPRRPKPKPSKSKRAKRKVIEGGGEFLNYQFGIAPLLSDIRKLNNAVIKSDLIVAQFKRDSGRLIRRSYSFPVTETEEVVSVKTGQGMFPALPTPMYASTLLSDTTGTLTCTRKVRIETWFSGGFTYYVDFDDDVLSHLHQKAQEIRRVYGLRLTPDVAWNLAPWSWAADWFANFGDVLKNASMLGADGLVMRYGYLMYQETVEDTYTHSGVNLKTGPTGPVSQVFRTVYKRRVKAHPYGFGLTDESLSPRQLAILAALGITRGRAD